MSNHHSFYGDSINEDYPGSWNKEEFEKIQSFTGKLRYANERLQKLASGSGRAVFKIDEQKVLKIAKNKKGLAQNKVESDWSLNSYEILAETFDIGEDVKGVGPFWVEMELAKKITKSRFKQLVGIPIDAVYEYLYEFHGTPPVYRRVMSDEEAAAYHENPFIIELMDVVGNYDMSIGDLWRTSTYGEVVRDGKPAVVLVDFGLTKTVWNDYYKVKF